MDTSTTHIFDLPRTILGSLTTTFTAPSSCSYLAVGYVGDVLVGWQGQKCLSDTDAGLADAQSCWPHTTAGAPYPNTPFTGWGFYSPGLICPAGYTSACTATASGDADWPVQFSMLDGETAVGCCPTGYTCTNPITQSGQSCYMLATSMVVTTGMCPSTDLVPGLMTIPRTTVITNEVTSSSLTIDAVSTSTLESMPAYAPMVQINWKSSDLVSKSTATLTTSVASTSASPIPNNNSSPSTGTIVGATVGATVGVLGILTAAFFLWRRRRKALQEKHPKAPRGQDGVVKEQWQGRFGRDVNATELPDQGHTIAYEMQG